MESRWRTFPLLTFMTFSLLPDDVIWCHLSWPPLAHFITCSLTVLCNYTILHWLVVGEVLWDGNEGKLASKIFKARTWSIFPHIFVTETWHWYLEMANSWLKLCFGGIFHCCYGLIRNPRGYQTKMGLCSLKSRRLTGIRFHIINLRLSDDRISFIMGVPIPIKRIVLVNIGHRYQRTYSISLNCIEMDKWLPYKI